ncbi:MAG: nucleotidyltransferase domain-containing protein [Candidatus Obscuribacterales bacterium]|nr:nucleotidyltransferase domain-containing protein [Candidatus Obscuribacterales bacterium]
MIYPDSLYSAINEHPYKLLFATVSGAHLYGFPSPDSDYDLRGAHILPVSELVGLEKAEETIEVSKKTEEIELDLVTHDVKKFFLLLLKKNGYVLEQLYSPLIVQGGETHEELKVIAKNCITRHHSHHYLGFADTQWRLFQKEKPRVKPLLYVYRVLLTGIHLMRTGEIEANLLTLNNDFALPYLPELIERKLKAGEKQILDEANMEFHRKEFERLRSSLEEAASSSKLPEAPTAQAALSEMLKRIRLSTR